MPNFLAFRTLYIRLKPDWVSIRVVSKNTPSYEYEDIPFIVIEGTIQLYGSGHLKGEKILAVGEEAIKIHKNQSLLTLLLNGFEHPRTIISDFDIAELTLKYLIQKACQGKFSLISPRIIIHPLEKLEGGLTKLENRALLELGLQVGGRQVYLYTERHFLSDEEVLNIEKNKQALKDSTFLKK